jgi:hypothetical protein
MEMLLQLKLSEIAKNEMGRRDYSEYVYIARAYMNSDRALVLKTLRAINLY